MTRIESTPDLDDALNTLDVDAVDVIDPIELREIAAAVDAQRTSSSVRTWSSPAMLAQTGPCLDIECLDQGVAGVGVDHSGDHRRDVVRDVY